MYFRHGAKSEPATSDDLRVFIEGRVEATRQAWLGNIRKLTKAPADAQVAIYRPTSSAGAPVRVQVTTDPAAPLYRMQNPDDDYPYRQKEVIAWVNSRLTGKLAINPHDIRCVRTVEHIDEKSAPQFCRKPKFGSMQFSELFVEWLTDRYGADSAFFTTARVQYSERTRTAPAAIRA